MNEPRKISPMDGDKLDPLSRPPVRIPSFSKLTGSAPNHIPAQSVVPPVPAKRRGRPPKAARPNDLASVIAALRVKRDKLSAAIEALEELG